jgi:ABC-type bacteriocin/lantibiotic exporter with double-glycine peptidase domain
LATAERSREAEPEVVRLRNLTVLKRMNVSFEKGKLICVIGDVGSGKSSLLSALLGDLQYLDSRFVEKEQDQDVGSEEVQKKVKKEAQQKATRGQEPILVNQSISYVQQVPWIQNKTIRDNITFGYEFDRKRYNRVIQICELTRDLEILPSGDQTEIGEKGINLSGGQKARVGLARAVYANKDMILMDDPISALDANVKKKIFENVFLGELRKKTRVLVTHAVDFLHLVDTIILLKDGEVLLQGSYEEIKDEPYLEKLMEIHKQHQSEQSKLNNAGEELQPLKPTS